VAKPFIKYVRLFQDTAGEWRFTAHAQNNEEIVTSSEGYTAKKDAKKAIRGVFGDKTQIKQEVPSPTPEEVEA